MIVPFSMKLWCLNEELVRFVSPYTGAQSPTRVWFSKWVCMISTFRKSVCPLNWHAFELYAYAYARGMLLKKKACNCQGLVIDCRFSSRGERAPGRAAPAGPNSLSWQRTQRSRMVRSRTALGLTICSSWPCSGITSLCTCMLKSCWSPDFGIFWMLNLFSSPFLAHHKALPLTWDKVHIPDVQEGCHQEKGRAPNHVQSCSISSSCAAPVTRCNLLLPLRWKMVLLHQQLQLDSQNFC